MAMMVRKNNLKTTDLPRDLHVHLLFQGLGSIDQGHNPSAGEFSINQKNWLLVKLQDGKPMASNDRLQSSNFLFAIACFTGRQRKLNKYHLPKTIYHYFWTRRNHHYNSSVYLKSSWIAEAITLW